MSVRLKGIALAQADGKYKSGQPASMHRRCCAFVRRWDLRLLQATLHRAQQRLPDVRLAGAADG
jgi:hypothetical protein